MPDRIHPVTFKTQVVGDSTWATYQTVLSDASGKVADPGIPSKFGYAFSGWKTEEGTVFDFANDAVNGDMTLYGTYTMITEYEVPLKAKVSVDATGKATPAVVQMRSFTPAPLKVSSIWCNFEKSATDVLDQATLDRTAVTVAMPLGANPQLLNDDSGVMPGKATLPAATSSASPGILEYSLGMSLPDDALVKFWGDGWTTPVAKLTYTVGPAS